MAMVADWMQRFDAGDMSTFFESPSKLDLLAAAAQIVHSRALEGEGLLLSDKTLQRLRDAPRCGSGVVRGRASERPRERSCFR